MEVSARPELRYRTSSYLCGPCNSLKGTRSHAELLVLFTDKGWIKRKKAAWPETMRWW